MKLGVLIKEAFQEAGISLPKKVDRKPENKNKKKDTSKLKLGRQQTSGTHAKKNEPKKKRKPGSIINKNKTYRRSDGKLCRVKPFIEPREEGNVSYTPSGVKVIRNSSSNTASSSTKKNNHQKSALRTEQKTIYKNSVKIQIHPDARVTWGGSTQSKPDLLNWEQNGCNIELGLTKQIKHLFLGLDFGTSTLKAVIHDKEREYSYAVPFENTSGIREYLLPCHICMDKEEYSLEHGDILSRDLKLAFLAQPENQEAQHRIVAFLALALQKIRAWLLSVHGNTYNGSIVWNMTMGLPVTHSQDQHLVEIFRNLGTAAWIASTKKKINQTAIDQSIIRAEELNQGAQPDYHEDIAVDIEPEITAQIYGFVSSTAYDPNAKNFYLMVDIGAGTLDASVFHIKRGERRRNEADFSIFRTTIMPHGAMNWHSERISWLLSALQNNNLSSNHLIHDLEKIHRITDSTEYLPERIDGYFEKLTIELSNEQCPDEKFYSNVKRQVAADTYLYVEQNNLIERHEMTGMPMFLCGGGSRLSMYQRLKTDMRHAQNARWYGVKPRTLHIPETLLAPGLIRTDYDRLSVAYGLAQMKSKKINYEVPPLENSTSLNYQSRYVNKDLL